MYVHAHMLRPHDLLKKGWYQPKFDGTWPVWYYSIIYLAVTKILIIYNSYFFRFKKNELKVDWYEPLSKLIVVEKFPKKGYRFWGIPISIHGFVKGGKEKEKERKGKERKRKEMNGKGKEAEEDRVYLWFGVYFLHKWVSRRYRWGYR